MSEAVAAQHGRSSRATRLPSPAGQHGVKPLRSYPHSHLQTLRRQWQGLCHAYFAAFHARTRAGGWGSHGGQANSTTHMFAGTAVRFMHLFQGYICSFAYMHAWCQLTCAHMLHVMPISPSHGSNQPAAGPGLEPNPDPARALAQGLAQALTALLFCASACRPVATAADDLTLTPTLS